MIGSEQFRPPALPQVMNLIEAAVYFEAKISRRRTLAMSHLRMAGGLSRGVKYRNRADFRLFGKRDPKLVEVLHEAETDILAYYGLPVEHRRQVWSINSLGRLNKEASRRCDVVGIFPAGTHRYAWPALCSKNRTTSGRLVAPSQ